MFYSQSCRSFNCFIVLFFSSVLLRVKVYRDYYLAAPNKSGWTRNRKKTLWSDKTLTNYEADLLVIMRTNVSVSRKCRALRVHRSDTPWYSHIEKRPHVDSYHKICVICTGLGPLAVLLEESEQWCRLLQAIKTGWRKLPGQSRSQSGHSSRTKAAASEFKSWLNLGASPSLMFSSSSLSFASGISPRQELEVWSQRRCVCPFGRRTGRRRRSLDVTATPCGKLCVFQWRCCYLQRDAQRDTSTPRFSGDVSLRSRGFSTWGTRWWPMNWQPVSVTSACQFCRPLLRLSCWTSTSSWCHGRFYNWWLFVTSYVIGCCFWSIFCKLNKSEFVALCADESVIYLLRLINLAGGGRVHSDVRLINSLPWICINEKDKREAERYANIIMTHKCNYRAIKGVVRMQIHAKKTTFIDFISDCSASLNTTRMRKRQRHSRLHISASFRGPKVTIMSFILTLNWSCINVK